MDIEDLFNYANCAFRLESLANYSVSAEDTSFSEYVQTGRVPVNHNQEWRELVANNTRRGCSMTRLRVISNPPSLYERFELDGAYEPGLSAGEEIRIVQRAEVRDDLSDFWLFDDYWMTDMVYSEEGQFLAAHVRPIEDVDHDMIAYVRSLYHHGIRLVGRALVK